MQNVPVKNFFKFVMAMFVMGAMDFWLWPQMNYEDTITVHGNLTSIPSKEVQWQSVSLYLDDFFDQWHTDNCFKTLDCEFINSLVLFGCYSFISIMSVMMNYTIPRFGIGISIFAGSVIVVWHNYVVRGRFKPPESLSLWSSELGVLFGPMLWGCLSFMCEESKSGVVLAANNP